MWPLPKTDHKLVYRIARNVAIVAGLFSLVVSLLMVTNYLQMRTFDPAKNEPLEQLIAQLRQNANDAALREQIRVLDLVSRKALFLHQWQLKTGAYLLLGGIIVLLAALKTIDSMQQKMPLPQGVPDESEAWRISTKVRQWTAGIGIALAASALILAFFSYDALDENFVDQVSAQAVDASLVDGVDYWANFRGPGGNGVAKQASPPAKWQPETDAKILWKADMPAPGFSSPIVWQNHVFLTGGNENGLFVYAFDSGDGSLLWQHQAGSKDDADFADFEPFNDTGYAAPTMTTDGRTVFAIFSNGQVVALDFEGNEKWQKRLGIPDNHYGHASSLLMCENLLIVQYDQSTNGKLLALDAYSGNTIWRVNRELISWSSPICVNTGSRMELIVTNSQFVDAFDPKSGVKLWSLECLHGEQGPSPAYANGLLVVANESSQASGIRIGPDGGEVIWEYFDELPDAASPLVTDELVFIPTAYGALVCLDAQTGEPLWDQRFERGFVASPLLLGDLVFAVDMSGVLHVFEADRSFKSVGEFSLGEKSSCTPAFANGKLFIRTEKSLLAIGAN